MRIWKLNVCEAKNQVCKLISEGEKNGEMHFETQFPLCRKYETIAGNFSCFPASHLDEF